MQYLNNAKNQAVGLARNVGNNLQQSNADIANLNQAIMQKGINGLSPEEKQLFQQYYMTTVMGITSAPSNTQLAKQLSRMPLSGEDRNIMGQFGELVEKGGRKAMGNVGYQSQRIAEGLGGEATGGNKYLADLFNRAVLIMDRLKGVK